MSDYKFTRIDSTALLIENLNESLVKDVDRSKFRNVEIVISSCKSDMIIKLARLELQVEFSQMLDSLEIELKDPNRPFSEIINRFIYFIKQIGSRNRDKNEKIFVLGLYGEFCTLEKLFIEGLKTKKECLDAWRRPAMTIYDFMFDGEQNIETKVVSRTASAFDVSSEYQLSNSSAPLNLWLHKVEISDSEYDSVAEKYNAIYEMLRKEPDGEYLSNCFREKSLSGINNRSYEGPEDMLLKYKVDLISTEIFKVTDGFPRLVDLPNGVHSLKYRVDLSQIAEFKIKSYG